jgi:hypothetical protein
VVLLTRDASLVVAVKALLDDEDRVSELESARELPPAGELPVDAVVVDLPKASRAATIERVRGRFSGPLVVLLGHGEDPARARVAYRCSVLTRPFGMAQLWSMLVNSATEAVTEIIAPVPRRDPPLAPGRPPSPDSRREAPGGRHERAPRGEPPREPRREPPGGTHEREPPREPRREPSPEPRLQAPGGSLQRPPGTPERPAPAPQRPAASRRVADAPPPAPERPTAAQRPAAQRPAAGTPSPAPERAMEAARGERAPAPGPPRAARADATAGAQPDRATREGGRTSAWSWRLRRFQHAPAEAPEAGELTQPMPAVPASGNGLPAAAEQAPPRPEAAAAAQPQVPVQPRVEALAGDPGHRPGDPAPPVAASQAATREEPAPDPPEAVAGRLAERLGADAVALLLDNNHGLLEVAGGVGLTTTERQLQVEYGHEVLIELFRVGVGLIEDTERVRGLIRGIPGSRSQTLIMVPLVHEGHGFGALIVGRTGRPGGPRSEFTEAEIEALMDFAEDVAAPLRSTVLLRRLKGQLNTPDRS